MASTATMPPQGIGEAFGLSQETTYGIAVDPAVFWRPVSNTLRRKDPWSPLTGPTGSAVGMTTTRAERFQPDVSGTVVVEADYDYIGWMINFGVAASTVAGPIETTAYTHTSTMAATIPASTNPSFTGVRITELDVGGNQSFQYTGCMIDNLEISGAGDRLVTVSADIIAQSGGSGAVADTIGTLSTSPFIEFSDTVLRAAFSTTGASLTSSHDQKSGAEALDWTVRLENGLLSQMAAGTRTAAGAPLRGIRQPRYGGYRRATMTVSRDYFDNNFLAQYHHATRASTFGTFGINSISNELAGATTQPYTMNIVFSAGHIVDGLNEYGGGPDVLGETIQIVAGYDGVNAPVQFVLINQRSANYLT